MTYLVPLTNSLKVEQGAHILYFYESYEKYVDNAVSFIETGIALGQYIVFIDTPQIYESVLERLGKIDMSKIKYVCNFEFYEMYHDFHFERVLKNLKDVFQPYVDGELIVRLWGHVDWLKENQVLSRVKKYECSCDIAVDQLGYTTVCAYESGKVSANVFLEMMRSHTYIMTDNEIVRSGLYKTSNLHNPSVFPSLSAQSKIESEMDLYKQKLDFVHVVSHEVRNPLTVIKSYAALLANEEKDKHRIARLEAIKNYAVVIDHEISHIINTEQMLSTDAVWQKKLLLAKDAIEEVYDIMKIKAQTQGITLIANIMLCGNEMILANLIGFKLVLSNLLSNAIKYSFEGSAIYLDVTEQDQYLHFKIKDHGIGMSQEEIQKLFRKYEKVNQEQSGQGIGLFMVKKLVDHFNGTVRVESEKNVGTTFFVNFPVNS